jgi:hypothetical protein
MDEALHLEYTAYRTGVFWKICGVWTKLERM